MLRRDEAHPSRRGRRFEIFSRGEAVAAQALRAVFSSMSSAESLDQTSTPPLREPRILVALATYNEVENVPPLVHAIREQLPNAAVLIVDDNSPDGTGEAAEALKASMPEIHVLHREGKLGLGTAILAAMRYAIENDYDLFINLDADFSHPPRFLPSLLAGMNQHDVMIGSRYVPGGGVQSGFHLVRKMMSSGINWYTRLLLGLNSRDNSGSYRCYRVEKLEQIDFEQIRSRGYSFMEEILFWCKVVGCKIGETPIIFEDRRAGVSKINKREAIRALQIIFQLGVLRLLGRIPSRSS